MEYTVKYPDDIPDEICCMVMKNMKKYESLLSLNLQQLTDLEELITLTAVYVVEQNIESK